eukprot:gene14945-6090_t
MRVHLAAQVLNDTVAVCLDKPYSDVSDSRSIWLDQFLQYFFQWKDSIRNFSENARSSIFISWQKYESLRTSVLPFKEVSQFFLQNGVPYVLSNRFFQDDLENYFGRQGEIGSRRDNPSVRGIGYNDNTIESQFSVRPIA